MGNGGIGTEVIQWYYEFLGDDSGSARATRAKLRRCKTIVEVITLSETHHLNRNLLKLGERPRTDQLALIAVSFANIARVQGQKIATQFGLPLAKDGARTLSDLRFQSLIRIRERRDLITPFCRALGVLGANVECNGYQLAKDLYYWSDEVRIQWCFQYFGADFANANTTEN